VLATEARGQVSLLVRVVDRVRGLEHVLECDPHATAQLRQQQHLGVAVNVGGVHGRLEWVVVVVAGQLVVVMVLGSLLALTRVLRG